MLDEFRAERSDLQAYWDEQESTIKAEHEKRLSEISKNESDKRNEQLRDGMSAILDVTAKYYEGMEGEEAGYARAAIQLGKALLDDKTRNSLKSLWASTHTAAMGAYEALSSIPYVGPGLGAAAAAGIYSAGAIAAAGLTGMAHDGIDSVPQTGTWLLERKESALPLPKLALS